MRRRVGVTAFRQQFFRKVHSLRGAVAIAPTSSPSGTSILAHRPGEVQRNGPPHLRRLGGDGRITNEQQVDDQGAKRHEPAAPSISSSCGGRCRAADRVALRLGASLSDTAGASDRRISAGWRCRYHASCGFPAARLSRGSRFRYSAMRSRPVRDRMHFHQWKRREFMASVPRPIRFPTAVLAPRHML